jgi:hypothetical protein
MDSPDAAGLVTAKIDSVTAALGGCVTQGLRPEGAMPPGHRGADRRLPACKDAAAGHVVVGLDPVVRWPVYPAAASCVRGWRAG